MKYRLPEDCAGVSHDGETCVVGPDRTIEADPGDAAALAIHGVIPCDDIGGVKPIDAMSRAELLGALEARRVEVSTSTSNAALRARLHRAPAVSGE